MKWLWLLIVIGMVGCAETEEGTKPAPDMPSQVDEKADVLTAFYTDFRQEVPMGEVVFDRYAPRGRHYYGYEMQLDEGDIVAISAGAVSPRFDSVIGLYGPKTDWGWGNVRAVNDDSEGTLDSRLDVEISESGTYLVLVRDYYWRRGEMFVSLDCLGGACDEPEDDVCGDYICAIYCENGNQLDHNGCATCSCNPEPSCQWVNPAPWVRCSGVETYAQNPVDGTCCTYPSPCFAPGEWETFTEPTCGAEPEPVDPEPVDPPAGECVTDADCMQTGCSGEICAAQSVSSICIYRPEFACYDEPTTSCGCNNGSCGWAQTDELSACLSGF